MDWGLLGSPQGNNFPPFSPPPSPHTPPLHLIKPENKISPSILLVIVILAIVFFISGLLQLLARCLLRPPRDPDAAAAAGGGDATALQGELRQLFHLHDAGVDQSFIDALPVFLYREIIGPKDPFDCAVCLCEFEPDDELRLLPKCSHAFHLECIDTWLLSHSTCPLCRRNLLADFSPGCSPVVLVLESASQSSRGSTSNRGDSWVNANLGSLEEDCEKPEDVEHIGPAVSEVSEPKVVNVRLGKFRNVDASAADAASGGEGSSSGNGTNLNERRCFSMGSFEYVMDDRSLLQVAIMPSKKKLRIAKPGHRVAMSECDYHSSRYGFREIERTTSSEFGSARINAHKRDSFSVSKVWLRSKEKPMSGDCSSRRASSFRLPQYLGRATDESKAKIGSSTRTTVSELDVAVWMKDGSELGSDVEVGGCNNSIASQPDEARSFAWRTFLWIVGRQNRVVNHG